LSRRLQALRDDLVHLEALLAYDIDFPEEDDGPVAPERITDAAHQVRQALAALLATAPRAALVREGALVVIAGPPNAGKSSLFNALLGEARALVTPIAGTTRDAIDAVIDRSPIPLRLVDTAGLRASEDALEQLGIEVSLRYLASARVVLACGATPEEVRRTCDAVATHTTATIVPVHTKVDLIGPDARRDQDRSVPRDEHGAARWCYASAETGEGLSALLTHIDGVVTTQAPQPTDAIVITRERHQRGLRDAHEEVVRFLEAWSSGAVPVTVAAVHLQGARDALAELVGAIGTEDILDRVFADFCIGK
jgi:tRNA modification GTPase